MKGPPSSVLGKKKAVDELSEGQRKGGAGSRLIIRGNGSGGRRRRKNTFRLKLAPDSRYWGRTYYTSGTAIDRSLKAQGWKPRTSKHGASPKKEAEAERGHHQDVVPRM